MTTGTALSGGDPDPLGQCMYTSYLPLASEPNLNVLHAVLLDVLSVWPLYAVVTLHRLVLKEYRKRVAIEV